MVEALAQVGASRCSSSLATRGSCRSSAASTACGSAARWSRGRPLDLRVEMGRLSARAGKGHGIASVGDEVACEVDLLFVIVDG